jgi:hypothetical protein
MEKILETREMRNATKDLDDARQELDKLLAAEDDGEGAKEDDEFMFGED